MIQDEREPEADSGNSFRCLVLGMIAIKVMMSKIYVSHVQLRLALLQCLNGSYPNCTGGRRFRLTMVFLPVGKQVLASGNPCRSRESSIYNTKNNVSGMRNGTGAVRLNGGEELP